MNAGSILASRLAIRWQVLLVLFLIRTAMGFQFQVVGSLGDTLVKHYAMDYAQLGTLVGLYLLPGLALALPSGFLGAWFGDRRALLTAIGLMIAGSVGAILATDFGMAAMARLVAGAGAVLLNVLLAKMVTDWFAGQELALAMAVLVNSWPFGMGLGLVLQPLLAESLGLGVAMASTTVFLTIAFVLAWWNGHEVPDAYAITAFRRPSALRRREIAGSLTAGIIWGCFNAAILIVLSFGPAMLLAQGVSARASGGLVSLVSWLGVTAVILGGWLAAQRDHGYWLMLLGFIAGALAVTMMPTPEWRLLAFATFGLIGFLPSGAIMALPGKILRPEARALGMGLYYTVFYAAVSFFPPLAGLARDLTMVPAAPLWLAAALLTFCLPSLWLFARLLPAEPQAAAAVSPK